MEILLKKYLSIKLKNNELSLIQDILQYIRCEDCNEIENECICSYCECCIKKIVREENKYKERCKDCYFTSFYL